MQMGMTPGYRDLFGDDPPGMDVLLEGIPSANSMVLMAKISEALYSRNNGLETQEMILDNWLGRNSEGKDKVLQAINSHIEANGQAITLFTEWHATEFMKYELRNWRAGALLVDGFSPEMELRLLWAYLAHVDEVHKDRQYNQLPMEKKRPPGVSREDWFCQWIWPMTAPQFEFDFKPDMIEEAFMAFALLDRLAHDPETASYCDTFLRKAGVDNFYQYIFDFLQISVVAHRELAEEDSALFSNNISDEGHEDFFENLRLQPEKFKDKNDFLDLRERPLWKIDDGLFVCLNWRYFINKVYTGLLFDFYQRSGIRKQYEKNENRQGFPTFKTEKVSSALERGFFQPILSHAFSQPRNELHFDDARESGFPDAYLRIGKKLFLFELKDTWMPSDVIEKGTYEAVLKDIDTKFNQYQNGKPKGVGQLVAQMKRLSEAGPFEADNFVEKKFKSRNLVVYPVLVYTHQMHSLPGIENYLNRSMKELVKEELTEKDGIQPYRVKPLTMVPLSYFYRFMDRFHRQEWDFQQELDDYHRELTRRWKRWRYTDHTSDLMQAMVSFDEWAFNREKAKITKEEGAAHLNTVFQVLGLPTGSGDSVF